MHFISRLSVITRLALLGALTMSLAVGATVIVLLNGVSLRMEAQAQGELETSMRLAWKIVGDASGGGSIRLQDGTLKTSASTDGGTALDDERLVDMVQTISGAAATIFAGDRRVATTIRDSGGGRATGTVLAAGPVHDRIFQEGLPFRGKAVILGTPFLTAYDPIKDATGQVVGILFTGVPESHVLQTIAQMRLIGVGVGAAAMILSLALFTVCLRHVMRAFDRLRGTVEDLASERLEGRVEGTERHDEVGAMARAIQRCQSALREARTLRAERAASEAERQAARRAEMQSLAQRFHAGVGTAFASVTEAIGSLESTSRVMSDTAELTARQAGQVSGAALETSETVDKVAAAAEELRASISEIGRQVTHASQVTDQAADEAARGDETAQALAGAADRVGDVVQLIASIASQTNLLALNATIEAARAGEAGRGFAVVASEVKDLAVQTQRATRDIGDQIEQIQLATQEVVSAMRRLSATSLDIRSTATAIAVAVEQQAAATGEIARHVGDSAASTRVITRSIDAVSGAADKTGSAASYLTQAAADLSREATTLSGRVEAFVAEVRAA